MPFVLLVDDSPVERRLAGGLMEKELDWLVEYASSGTEALTSMQLSLPDLLITDLMMPEMDGLQLVTEVRERYPQVPVILITAHGSESLAVEALERGAASYVPKSQLNTKLLDTARQVLALTGDDRVYARLLERMDRTMASFHLPNDPALLGRAVEHVVWQIAGMKVCDAADRRCLAVALEEALLNALLHGNLELTPEQVQQVRADTLAGECCELVAQRCEQDALRRRTIYLEYDISHESVRIVVRDEGRGFDCAKLAERRSPEAIELEGGRGLVLIRKFMDEVQFSATGNQITMIKRWN
jgi:CheY-like chemotaxis protein/anti-sigma regulatory factor (Ser/Thr protein kinase)